MTSTALNSRFLGRRLRRRLAALITVAALATACGTDRPPTDSASSDRPSSDAPSSHGEREVAAVTPRLLFSHEGGLTLLDTNTGEVLDETAHPGFLRLSPAGDGRHVMVADGDTFRVYDAGISTTAHGDHSHSYESDPGLTTTTYDAPHAGHVVSHHGLTTLFSDGTGSIQVVESADIADPDAEVERHQSADPHHGVALELSDGTLLTTEGTEEERTSVVVQDDGREVARTDECPGVHGETTARPTAQGDVVLLGCEDGPVVWRNGAFHKIAVDLPYVRTGNVAGSEHSPFVLTDHKTRTDPSEGEVERPTLVGIADTRRDTLRTIDLGSSYWFRSLARGPRGEGLVLTYDGHVRIFNLESGRQVASVPAIEPWRENTDWQQPGPAIKVAGDRAYVTDVSRNELVVVDLTAREVTHRFELPHTPVEIAVVTGSAESHAGHHH